MKGAGTSRGEGQHQRRPDSAELGRDERAHQRGTHRHRDAGDLEQSHPVAAIGDDTRRNAGEQQRQVPHAQRQAHHERRIGDLEDVPAEDDLLADHADRVEEDAEAETAYAVMSPQLQQRSGREAHGAHPIAS
jgi:hypothetical protein